MVHLRKISTLQINMTYLCPLPWMKVKDELGLLLNFLIRRKKEFDKLKNGAP